ncbi:MFS transporter [Protofrankia symbiont of Coriaria ruscifolia]|uniref:MFS transporter n=1 Tax=Protofrankia symbiont of Coriaria ruscifolia TaxID=1306542 RepID=UPI0013EFB84F|nr:MFS transporter [Protofrankia symbiont of Coriaria ruscifolia]
MATAGGLFVHAFVFASWIPHIPEVKASLALSDGELGLALLGAPAGAVLTMWAVGFLVGRVGSVPVIRASLVVYCLAGVLVVGAGSLPMLFVVLAFWGASGSGLDVAVNAQATDVERRYGRPIMSGLHAAWTAGALVGAVLGAAGTAIGTSLGWQFAGVGALGLAIGLPPTLMMLPRDAPASDDTLIVRYTPVPVEAGNVAGARVTGAVAVADVVVADTAVGDGAVGDRAVGDRAVGDRAVWDTAGVNAGNDMNAAVDVMMVGHAMSISDRGCPAFPAPTPISLAEDAEECEDAERTGATDTTGGRVLAEARNPRNLRRGPNVRHRANRPLVTLCLICLSSFLCEGVAADWSTLYLRDVTGASTDVAGIGFVLFIGTMLIGRLVGDRVIGAVGAARMVRVSAGTTSVVFLSALAVADTGIGTLGGIVGFGSIGVGLACVVPTAISAAGLLGARGSGPAASSSAGAAVARVISFGYVGWLIGPPLVGGLAEMINLHAAMIVVVVLAATVAILAPALSV